MNKFLIPTHLLTVLSNDMLEDICFRSINSKEFIVEEDQRGHNSGQYIILKNKIMTKQCSIEYAQGYLYCLINMCVNDDNLYDEYSRAIDDIGER